MFGMCSTANDAIKRERQRQALKDGLHKHSIVDSSGGGEADERTAFIEMTQLGPRSDGNHDSDASSPQHVKNSHGASTQHHKAQILQYSPVRTKPDDDKPQDYGKDWKRIAEIFDRLFFWLFLVSMLISTLVLFHPLTKTYMKQQGLVV
jgi:hypothetical protein